jgi:hypothetical protein
MYADIPFWNQGHADGTSTNWADAGAPAILGFNTSSAPRNAEAVTFTAAGIVWGLTQTWTGYRAADGSVAAAENLTVLATTAPGHAAAWAKHYLPGDTYRGFVRLADFDVTTGSPVGLIEDLLRVAEYKGALMYDMYEDNAINFKDYTVFANQYLDEILWP